MSLQLVYETDHGWPKRVVSAELDVARPNRVNFVESHFIGPGNPNGTRRWHKRVTSAAQLWAALMEAKEGKGDARPEHPY